MSNLKQKNIGDSKILSILEKMEANIGVQENLLMYLIIISGETFKRHL